MHVPDAVPSWDASRRSTANIADEIDRDEEYVRGELKLLEASDIVDFTEDGEARLQHQHIVVAPLASNPGTDEVYCVVADTDAVQMVETDAVDFMEVGDSDDSLDKPERAERGLRDLRAVLEEMVAAGTGKQPDFDVAHAPE
jgi:hypothetical protein